MRESRCKNDSKSAADGELRGPFVLDPDQSLCKEKEEKWAGQSKGQVLPKRVWTERQANSDFQSVKLDEEGGW